MSDPHPRPVTTTVSVHRLGHTSMEEDEGTLLAMASNLMAMASHYTMSLYITYIKAV